MCLCVCVFTAYVCVRVFVFVCVCVCVCGNAHKKYKLYVNKFKITWFTRPNSCYEKNVLILLF